MFLLLVALFLACALALTFLFPNAAAILWVLVLETSPDDWLDRLAGPAHHETIIAVIKAFGLVLAACLMLRFGARRDRYNPSFAFATMFCTGLMHGLYPGLTLLSSVRSLIGSASPFLFSFARLPADFCTAVIWATLWGPLCAIAFDAVLTGLGLDHMYVVELGAVRLGAAGQPPFLAGFALIGVYAGLLEFLRHPRPAVTASLAANVIIILLTGARAPLAIACFDILALLLLQRRLIALAGAGALAAAALLFSSGLGFLRVVGLTQQGQATNLSHRDIVWPYFQHAFWSSPLLGWGVGAGKVIIPVTSQIDSLLGTNAAHNEYLRLGAEGGVLGLALLIALLILWVRRGSAAMPPAPRWMMRLIFLGFALHSATDNTMIATTSSAFFLWASASFATAENTRYTSHMITRRLALASPLALFATQAFGGTPPPICMVMNSAGASISVIDMNTRKIIATEPALREPSHWALTPDRQTLYVADASGNAFFAFDPITGAPKGHVKIADPYQLGYSPDNRYLVVNALRLNYVDVYDAATLNLVKRFSPGKMPSHLDFSPDSRWCFSSQQQTDSLFSFDMTTLTPRWTVRVGNTPAGVLWLNGKLIVCIMGEDGIIEVDPIDGHITRRQKTGPGAHNVFLDTERNILYISNRGPGQTSLSALDPVSLKIIRDYPLPGGPDDIGIAPDGKIWIALRFAEDVAILDPVTGDYDKIPVGRSPHGLYLSTMLSHKGRLTAETV